MAIDVGQLRSELQFFASGEGCGAIVELDTHGKWRVVSVSGNRIMCGCDSQADAGRWAVSHGWRLVRSDAETLAVLESWDRMVAHEQRR